MKQRIVVVLCLFWLFLSGIYGQNYQMKGTVIDRSTRQPLEFVNVLVVGLGTGASTDAEGNFTISKLPPGIYLLHWVIKRF